MFHDLSFDQAVNLAKVVSYLTEDKQASTNLKLQNIFYAGIRKSFSKRNVKQLPFDDSLKILDALPPVEGDAVSSSKSLHYLLLNEMLSPQLAANRWSTLEKDEVFRIVERCMDMGYCRDLNNKLRGCLLHIKTHQFSLEDFSRLFRLLAD